jgi:hypothetical protein
VLFTYFSTLQASNEEGLHTNYVRMDAAELNYLVLIRPDKELEARLLVDRLDSLVNWDRVELKF